MATCFTRMLPRMHFTQRIHGALVRFSPAQARWCRHGDAEAFVILHLFLVVTFSPSFSLIPPLFPFFPASRSLLPACAVGLSVPTVPGSVGSAPARLCRGGSGRETGGQSRGEVSEWVRGGLVPAGSRSENKPVGMRL